MKKFTTDNENAIILSWLWLERIPKKASNGKANVIVAETIMASYDELRLIHAITPDIPAKKPHVKMMLKNLWRIGNCEP